ncbi:MAG: 16S rRNA (guanine(966)-N(2))-methyltransferase RsmD [Bacteroidaceae bacterium]|nr:16S rRNA (guanine(966)-N(2))-methyltransferase RsmD [Bacteroidaceae bacterium]
MRVIAGKYKHRHFAVPANFKARPTTDFAKENLFNVLTNLIDFEGVSALDLFAGTGSISLELLSRGAASVVSVELNSMHYNFIRKVMESVGDKGSIVIHSDVFKFLSHQKTPYDFIFADPPYALKEIAQIPDIILSKGLLAPDGLFVLEHGENLDFSSHPSFLQHREYGSVNFSFFGNITEEVKADAEPTL